jgi:hypothetical protein
MYCTDWTTNLLLTFYSFNSIYPGYQICGVVAKLLFVANLTEAHLGMFESIEVQLAAVKLANTTRRNFLRYVFHEVRTHSMPYCPVMCLDDYFCFLECCAVPCCVMRKRARSSSLCITVPCVCTVCCIYLYNVLYAAIMPCLSALHVYAVMSCAAT